MLDEITARRMQDVGYVELPSSSISTTQTHTLALRFSVSTQSLDRIWMVYRDGTLCDSGGWFVGGYKVSAFTSTATIADTRRRGCDARCGKPTYDIGGSACTNQEKYQTKFFKFEEIVPPTLPPRTSCRSTRLLFLSSRPTRSRCTLLARTA